VKTELTEIQGIGEKIADKLLQEFGSVEKISRLSAKELEPIVGMKKSEILIEYFRKKP
jgi:excinuclease ABC subunit C